MTYYANHRSNGAERDLELREEVGQRVTSHLSKPTVKIDGRTYELIFIGRFALKQMSARYVCSALRLVQWRRVYLINMQGMSIFTIVLLFIYLTLSPLFICLTVFPLFIYLFVYPSIFSSVNLPLCLSVYPPTIIAYLSLYLSMNYLSIHPSVFPTLYVCLYIYA